jgi:radical SAM superfamily enzyme YgiQ (UPF0313 family)
LATCATLLRRAGIQADVHDETVQGPCTAAGDYDYLVVLTSSLTFDQDAAAISALRQGGCRPATLWFGTHPTFRPRECLDHEAVDWVLVGEPEVALEQFFLAGRAAGVYGKKDVDREQRFVGATPLDDLDGLPFTDRRLVPPWQRYPNPFMRGPYATCTTSRGCGGRCTFCTAPGFYGRRYRAQSPERVMSELEAVGSEGCRSVFFRDENFAQDRGRVWGLCDLLAPRRRPIEWVCSARVDQVDRELVRALASAGCRMIRFGVESGSQRLLDRLHKGTTVEQAMQAFRWCREAGVRTHAHFMLGLPGETDAELADTLRLSRSLGATYATFGAFTYLPGSVVGNAATEGTVRETLAEDGMAEVREGGEEDCRLRAAQRRAYRGFYLRPGVMLREALGLMVEGGAVRRLRSAASVAAMALRSQEAEGGDKAQETM